MKRKYDIEVGDWIICKKDYYDHSTIFTSPMVFHKGDKYKIYDIDDDDITVLSLDDVSPKTIYYFVFEKERINYWEKYFYTKSELRNIKLNELGI